MSLMNSVNETRNAGKALFWVDTVDNVGQVINHVGLSQIDVYSPVVRSLAFRVISVLGRAHSPLSKRGAPSVTSHVTLNAA